MYMETIEMRVKVVGEKSVSQAKNGNRMQRHMIVLMDEKHFLSTR